MAFVRLCFRCLCKHQLTVEMHCWLLGSELLGAQYHVTVHVDGPPPFKLVVCKTPIM